MHQTMTQATNDAMTSRHSKLTQPTNDAMTSRHSKLTQATNNPMTSRHSKLHYLLVRSLPSLLGPAARRALLQHFGAVDVQPHSYRGKNQAVVAGFKSAADCRFAMTRLHQLNVFGRNLHATLYTYKPLDNFVPPLHQQPQQQQHNQEQEQQQQEADGTALTRLQELEAQLTALSSALPTLLRPLPPHLRYKYPAPSPLILTNITNTLASEPRLYTQLLHLMNKMNLPPPFIRRPVTTNKPIATTYTETTNTVTKTHESYRVVLISTEDEPQTEYEEHKDNLENTNTNEIIVEDAKLQSDARLTFQDITNVCDICKRTFHCKRKRICSSGVLDNVDEVNSEENADNILSTDSSTSESELESSSEDIAVNINKKSMSFDQVRALKRPRKSTYVPDVRKRAKLQLQQEKQIHTQETMSKKTGRSALLKAFGLPRDTRLRSLQLNLPLTINSMTNRDSNTVNSETNRDADTSKVKEGLCPTEASQREKIPQHGHENKTQPDERKTDVNIYTEILDKDSSKDDRNSRVKACNEDIEGIKESVTSEEVSVSTGFGKIESKKDNTAQKSVPSNYISLEELESNRVKEADYAVIGVLARYSPGSATRRLYVKNLAKATTVAHLHRIFLRYLHLWADGGGGTDDDDGSRTSVGGDCAVALARANPDQYHIRLLTEGRMKGQAFITLPSLSSAETARKETNGFILHDKPMVVAFAKEKPPAAATPTPN